MYKKVYSATSIGVDAQLVTVEVDIAYGLLQWFIVGLPDAAIKESRQRIAAALKNSGIKVPDRKITINLAPADLKKEGTAFDLPIAIGILLASEVVQLSDQYLEDTLWLGELALDGSVHATRGILPVACDAKKLNKKRLIVPAKNMREACAVEGLEIIAIDSIKELVDILTCAALPKATVIKNNYCAPSHQIDFADVHGQQIAKRALQIAASGGHNVMLVGAPGSGKTMLAERLITIMPHLTKEEQIEVSKIYSIAGMLTEVDGLVQQRPFRAPHHTISPAGLLGGGSIPQPGELSFAHHGILFLDELLEFRRSVLEQLRQPLEKRSITISRAQAHITFPAAFTLVAAMNPCPCGYFGDQRKSCACSAFMVEKYLQKLSGPLLDRIDLQVGIQSIAYENMQTSGNALSSSELYEGVQRARAAQIKRMGSSIAYNVHIFSREIEKYCRLSAGAHALVKSIFNQGVLSMRSYHKLIKVARTIADIEGADTINESHVQEACMYRTIDSLMDQWSRLLFLFEIFQN